MFPYRPHIYYYVYNITTELIIILRRTTHAHYCGVITDCVGVEEKPRPDGRRMLRKWRLGRWNLEIIYYNMVPVQGVLSSVIKKKNKTKTKKKKKVSFVWEKPQLMETRLSRRRVCVFTIRVLTSRVGTCS